LNPFHRHSSLCIGRASSGSGVSFLMECSLGNKSSERR
jgi:hypothetical protein